VGTPPTLYWWWEDRVLVKAFSAIVLQRNVVASI